MDAEQDDELAGLESTVLSTKHIAFAVNEELDLQTRLLVRRCACGSVSLGYLAPSILNRGR